MITFVVVVSLSFNFHLRPSSLSRRTKYTEKSQLIHNQSPYYRVRRMILLLNLIKYLRNQFKIKQSIKEILSSWICHIESVSVVKSDCRRLLGLNVTRHSPVNLQQVEKQFHLSEKVVNVSPGIFHLTLNFFESELQCWFTQHALPTAPHHTTRKWNSDPEIDFSICKFSEKPFYRYIYRPGIWKLEM